MFLFKLKIKGIFRPIGRTLVLPLFIIHQHQQLLVAHSWIYKPLNRKEIRRTIPHQVFMFLQ